MESFELQLFDWIGWDQQDTMAFGFSDVTLKVKIGDYEPGTFFDYADVDFERARVEFFLYEKGDDPVLRMSIKATLVPFVE